MFQRMRWPELEGWRIGDSDSAVCMVGDDGNARCRRHGGLGGPDQGPGCAPRRGGSFPGESLPPTQAEIGLDPGTGRNSQKCGLQTGFPVLD